MENPPVVIAQTSGTVQAGHAGEDVPSAYFENVLGTEKVKRDGGTIQKKYYFGCEAFSNGKKKLELSYPIVRGKIRDWDAMEKVWDEVYGTELKVKSDTRGAIVSEYVDCAKMEREMTMQIFFESFQVPSFYSASHEMLSVFASGHQSVLVLRSDEDTTYTVGVYQNSVVHSSIRKMEIGEWDLQTKLLESLAKKGFTVKNPWESRIASEILRQTCYFALNFQEEYNSIKKKPQNYSRQFELPDGTVLFLDIEQVEALEGLFTPTVLGKNTPGVVDTLFSTISSLNSNSALGAPVTSNLILSGSTTVHQNFSQRLSSLIYSRLQPEAICHVVATFERKFMSWIGGSIVGSLDSFGGMAVCRSEFEEDGGSVVHRKCL